MHNSQDPPPMSGQPGSLLPRAAREQVTEPRAAHLHPGSLNSKLCTALGTAWGTRQLLSKQCPPLLDVPWWQVEGSGCTAST